MKCIVLTSCFSDHSREPPQRDRVKIAFDKFDLDRDGYLNWDEFMQV